jgi:hypothetical protein
VALAVSSSSGNWVVSARFLATVSGGRLAHVELVAVTTVLDQQWSNSAGLSQTFSNTGAMLFRATVAGTPHAGVVPTANGSVISSTDVFYISASQPQAIDSSLSQTSAAGSALIINQSLVNHGGQGGEPAGCQWPDKLGAAIPGLIMQFELSPVCN